MTRQLMALLALVALCVSAAQAKTCARREWRHVFGSRGGRLTSAHAQRALRRIAHAVAEERALQRRTGTVGCHLVDYSAIIGCNDNSPVKPTTSRANLWFVKYRAAYSCPTGHRYLTIWAYTDSPNHPHTVMVPQAKPSGRW